MREKIRNERGITLIALVITIIVLLILAGVSLSLVAGGDGIIDKASNAVDATNVANAKEAVNLYLSEAMMEYYSGEYLPGGIKTGGTLQEYINNNIVGNVAGYTIENDTKGNIIVKDKNGNELAQGGITTDGTINWGTLNTTEIGTTPPSAPTYTAYAIGEEVSLISDSNEQFYVLEASDENTEMVTLLAKYNLNKTKTDGKWKQAHDANYSATRCAFSENSSLTFTAGEDLNENETVLADATSAVYKANEYATTTCGGTKGSLLTYGKASGLADSYGDMIWGTANQQDDGNYLYYWLGSAQGTNNVWSVGGYDVDFYIRTFDFDLCFGVRPVIKISKSLIQ